MALNWIKSYLQNRHQCVQIGDVVSYKVHLSSGIPQGSVLGPLLFLIYILPLKNIIDQYNINRHGYADDTQLYCRLPVRDPILCQKSVSQMESCVSEVRKWLLCNWLMFNDSKTEYIIIATRKHHAVLNSITIKVGDEVIQPKTSVRNLGAILDNTLSMEKQISAVVRSANFHLRRIGQIRCHLDNDTCAKTIHATVTSRLDYHNGLLAGIPNTQLRRLQLVQNKAARLLSRTSKTQHITPVLFSLHWLPIKQRISYKILTVVYKALNNTSGPLYIKDLLPLYQPARHLRSADSVSLVRPKIHRAEGERTLSAHGALLWNKLPVDIRHSVSLPVFKKSLKTFLFKAAFCHM